MKRRDGQWGQALTEFTVAAGFILIPAFLLIPLLGKYIDIQHSAIQAARYESWEYTAWHASDGRPGGYKETRPYPVKSPTALKKEARRRFFSDPGLQLNEDGEEDRETGWVAEDRNVLWQDHRGTPLLDNGQSGEEVTEAATPDVTGVVTRLINAFHTVSGFVEKVLELVGLDAGFTVTESRGYYKAESKVNTVSLDWFDPNDTLSGVDDFKDGLTFQARAAVLSRYWNAGSRRMTKHQTKGLVPTAALDNEALASARKVVDTVASPFLPEMTEDNLQFGKVDTETVPPDRLTPSAGAVVCQHPSDANRGICEFE
ncbi:MAG TPA: hypothetical protein VKA64_10060 [Gammaproteobacteria bacterium]|nr:hypothetical protein [Gammaproteobacteria bacterium]